MLDGVDQTIFQAVDATSVLDNYQSYDKALDVYYLTIAYASTLRNWLDPFALGVARFLFYYRLVGTLAFELTGVRTLLLVFPNTFEYFFIFYEAVRLFWNPRRMSRRFVVGAAAAIWIVVKLPQEYWIHIAELDVTDQQAPTPVAAAGGLRRRRGARAARRGRCASRLPGLGPDADARRRRAHRPPGRRRGAPAARPGGRPQHGRAGEGRCSSRWSRSSSARC